ncbi:class II fructose-bisphosphate aldolase [Clostridium perfringens]|uniref:class II fructose-bisphosphate aldolase n=1 Tax=Clostridium perfringens TaxID=1502 RepID=UPI001E3A0148|nr:class II fructose-bisphosphate aldolase [Clostridium perfringens]MCC5421317.1 class II aldolase [Clostridium perfringens]MCC5430836.1 class II aldolase [Clostridium perfringens]MCC5446484.1 class II aldolase [Clostridium perfringens]MCC5449896.1 class II aldolase [Clostridium perfringens]MDK0968837.1 class II aldolase [Clostridium perfringens]
MALVKMIELLDAAREKNYAVGSFSIANMEMVKGALKAAEEMHSPMILQIAEVRLANSPLELIGPLMVSAAKNAKVPVAVHFDHGLTLENIEKALKIGFTSVMIDGSHLSFDENVKITKRVKELADKYGAAIEAEIGQVGGSEDGSEDIKMKVTNVEDAKRFVQETKVDALAVAIGNAHGVYKGTPKLRFDVLENLRENIETPLVLHGGSGITPEDFKACKNKGIRKINIATATFNSVEESVRKLYVDNEKKDYFTLQATEVQGAYENVKKHMDIFESVNKA